MRMITNFNPPQEVVITPEAMADLHMYISQVQVGVLKSWKNFPQAIQNLVQEISIDPDLHDTEPDAIKIEIKIQKEESGIHPKILVKEFCVITYIKCLDPDIETRAETVFKTVLFTFVEQLSMNLQEFLHTILVQKPPQE